ncbi:hypothetical protein VN97_g12045 [Penicillium thymicola]|uniref:Uncharacterized protein n=1 Tax=Penicillium thymicola TaxID=293382 RepID=A0AAI9T6Z5_PENTH|nr:hypothetical protein VN97_g12045 [Penicillium thymicola]
MYTTRFDIKEEQRLVLQEYPLDHEVAASAETLDVQTHAFEAISDDEENIELRLDTPTAISITQATPDAPPFSEVAAEKRPAVNSDNEEDSDADEFADPDKNRASLLPDFPDTQHRASGRMRKKSRLLGGCIA